jgi:chaperonin cofactor prefoldin
LKESIRKVEGERDSVKHELEERIDMFEYNVKKNADDRKEYKNSLAKLQENY